MQSLTLFALLLEIAPAIASISPFMRFEQRSWTPPRETATATQADGELDGLMSPPAPTEAPYHPDYAGVELFKRFEMGTDTCGFAAGYKSEPWTCFKVGAFCATTGSIRGCCVGSTPDCFSTFVTTCVDYTSDTSSSSCGTGTVCCGSSSPSCFIWRYSTSATPNTIYSVFNCYSSGGVGTLLDAPPELTATTATKSNLNPSTTDSTTTTTQPADSGGSQAPVGAIVGGVVGGLAVIGIAVVAIFFLVVRHRRQAAAAAAGSTAPSTMGGGGGPGSHMSYTPQPPLASPAGTHQSGVYTFPQDANSTAPGHLSAYSGYAGYYAGEQGKPGYDPNLHANQMAQQGVQPQYTGTSDGTWTTNTHVTHSTQPSQPISELPSTEQRRAELG